MKRSWMGLILLILLALASVLSASAMVKLHESVEQELNRAAEAILEDNWKESIAHFEKAREQWQKQEKFRACFADHTPVEEIDAAFQLLQVYGKLREDAAFAAGCRELARKAAAVGEAHAFVWWNLL